jgi:hypothetical protein
MPLSTLSLPCHCPIATAMPLSTLPLPLPLYQLHHYIALSLYHCHLSLPCHCPLCHCHATVHSATAMPHHSKSQAGAKTIGDMDFHIGHDAVKHGVNHTVGVNGCHCQCQIATASVRLPLPLTVSIVATASDDCSHCQCQVLSLPVTVSSCSHCQCQL